MTCYCWPQMDREVSLCKGANVSNVPALRKSLRLPPEAERPGVSEAAAARYASVTAGESVAGPERLEQYRPPARTGLHPRSDTAAAWIRFCSDWLLVP